MLTGGGIPDAGGGGDTSASFPWQTVPLHWEYQLPLDALCIKNLAYENFKFFFKKRNTLDKLKSCS